MVRSGLLLLCIVLLLPDHVDAARSRFVAVDSEGNTISLTAPARRIVSLSPHITELLFAAGAGEYVVGVVEYSDYPLTAKKILRVGSALRVDMEELVLLKPDLVVAWTSGNSAGDIAAIKRFGIPIFYSDPKQLRDIPAALNNLAKLTATEEMAARSSAIYTKKYEKLLGAARQRGDKEVSVFYQLWHKPLMTVNSNHIINDVIELCGGKNVFSYLPALTPVVGIESVITANPQVIVASNVGSGELQSAWNKWPDMTAVGNGRFVTIPADLIHRQGPRIIEAAELMCRGIAATGA
jgi:iron complex transport system substrate-binding protein